MKMRYNMKKSIHVLTPLAVLAFVLIASSMAHAQLTRTWVSGVGNDANPCSRDLPCKTFAGALSQTAIAGEIDAIDAGQYGVVTINKSITIDGGYAFAGISAEGTIGVTVNLTTPSVLDPEQRVVLRRLSINGTGICGLGCGSSTGFRGINAISFKSLDVENCYIQNFSEEGILINLSTSASRVTVKDTNINRTRVGIYMTTTTGYVTGTFDKLRIDNCAGGVIAYDRAYITIRDSVIQACTAVGVSNYAPSNAAGLNLENTTLYSVNVGVQAGSPGTKVDLFTTSILNNSVGIASYGGTVNSHGNNRIANNTSPGVAPTLVGLQ